MNEKNDELIGIVKIHGNGKEKRQLLVILSKHENRQTCHVYLRLSFSSLSSESFPL